MADAAECYDEERLGIRAQFLAGYFDREEALVRIENDGFSQLTREQALRLLAKPISAGFVLEWTGRDVTEEQIAARLAKVNG